MKAILIIRLSAIGDVAMASSLLPALRTKYPHAHIAWLTQPQAVDLIKANPTLNEVIVWQRDEWARLWRQGRWVPLWLAFRRFRYTLRERHFDLALDLQGLMKSALWAYLSGAPERIGLDSREGSGHLMTTVVRSEQGSARISSEYLHLAQCLGLDTSTFVMSLVLSAEDEEFAANYIARHRLGAGYVVICPFTTRPQKHWLEERWAELGRRMRNDRSLPLVMLGGRGDKPAAERIAMLADGSIVNAVGRTTVGQATALVKRATIHVGVDTGLSHTAIAFARPSINLFGATRPYLETGRHNARVVYHELPCSPCRRNPTCEGAFTCMRLITVEQVLQAAARVLAPLRTR